MRVQMMVATLGVVVASMAVAAELHEGAPKADSMIEVPRTPAPQRTGAAVTVEMVAATLGDPCGTAPAQKPKPNRKASSETQHGAAARARRPCEPASMTLSVLSGTEAAPTTIKIKRVELFDENGTRIGELTSERPTAWSNDGVFAAWDEKVAAGRELSARYNLSQPDWTGVKDRWNKTFTLKVLVTVGGVDQTLESGVSLVTEVRLPPGVVT